MVCSGRKGTWTIEYTFSGGTTQPAIYADANEDDNPYFSNEGGRAVLRSACDGRNMEPPYFAGVFSSVSIVSESFVPNSEKYDCLNGTCVGSTRYKTPGIYKSLVDCQAVCANGGACSEGKQCVDPTTFCPDGKVCIDQGEFASIEALISKIGSEVC